MSPTSTEAPQVSVIIVTYQSRDLVGDAIDSVLASAAASGLMTEIIVIDNASSDGTADFVAERYPDTIVVRNDRNVGFGTANNQAFAVARGRRWMLLNPDARLAPRALADLMAAIDADPRLAAVGPSISGAGTGGAASAGELPGIRSLVAHFLFLNRILPRAGRSPWRGWQIRATAARVPLRVGWLSGAAVMLRPEAIQALGGFDESIFLYGEDLDLGYRLGAAEWDLAILASANAEHAIGGSQDAGSTRWIDGLEDYLVRRGRSRVAIGGCLLIASSGLTVRWLAMAIARRDRRHRSRMGAGARHALSRATRRLLGPT